VLDYSAASAKADALLAEFSGLPEVGVFFDEGVSDLADDLVWRKTKVTFAEDGSPELTVSFDLGSRYDVLLATLRAKVRHFGDHNSVSNLAEGSPFHGVIA
jgi:hypothetical protein